MWRYVGWGCILNCFMLSSLPCFYAFADLLSLHLVTFLMFFILVHVTFFSSRCMLELKFAIYYRAANLLSQASYAVLAEESQAFFKLSQHTNSISNSAILRNNYISLLSDLCACVHVKKNGVIKEAIVLQWVVRNASCDFQTWKKVMGLCTVQWKMLLFCAKTIVKESRKFELAHLKKKKKEEEEERKTFWPSGDFRVRYFRDAF